MGVWGTGIFASDTACDVRDEYRELIEDGVDDAKALRQTAKKFRKYFDSPEEGTAALVAFAVTQSKIGRLDPTIRDRALAAIDQGGDLHVWERDSPKDVGKRRAALAKARTQLVGPQPTRKRLGPPKRASIDLEPGDVLALDVPAGVVLIRTVRVNQSRHGDSPLFEELAFDGTKVPAAEIIQHLPAKKEKDNYVDENSVTEVRFDTMLDAKNAGWKQAGFRKVANIPVRKRDAKLASDSAIFWSALARLYRHPARHLN